MKTKITQGETGACSQPTCKRQPLIPFCAEAKYGAAGTQLRCVICGEMYKPTYSEQADVDGSHFGPNLVPEIALAHSSSILVSG